MKLSNSQKAAVAKSIRAQYANAKKYIPGPVVRARALRLVVGDKAKKR